MPQVWSVPELTESNATGHGVPPMNADENEKRLASLQLAREDAWENAYDQVRAEPATGGGQIGDLLAADPRARARVINAIWRAPVLEQTYDAETETAQVTIRCNTQEILLKAYAK